MNMSASAITDMKSSYFCFRSLCGEIRKRAHGVFYFITSSSPSSSLLSSSWCMCSSIVNVIRIMLQIRVGEDIPAGGLTEDGFLALS